jgi:hypothetical protein
MTKEEAYKLAESFLLSAYGNENVEYAAIALTAVANKDDWQIIKMLESFIKFENDIIDTLKNKEK